VASLDVVVQLISEWDISQTEVLLGKLEAEKEKRLEETKQRRAAEESMYVYKKTTVLLILTIVMGPSWSLSYGCSISAYHH
jgi:hypothetical protein